jgi:hypothetical protein
MEALKNQGSSCPVQPSASNDVKEGQSHQYDSRGDAIWRELMILGVQATLDTGRRLLRQAGALKSNRCDVPSHPDSVTPIFLPDFGELRLVPRARLNRTCSVWSTGIKLSTSNPGGFSQAPSSPAYRASGSKTTPWLRCGWPLLHSAPIDTGAAAEHHQEEVSWY